MARNEPSSPPLTATQAAWLLAGGILGAAPLLNRLPLTLGALVGAAFAWRGWLIFRRQRLPARGLLIFVTLGTVLAVLFHYRTLFGQQAGVALLAAFIALKQLEARAPRDGVTIVLLGFFLILAQFFENQSLPVVAVMVVQLVVLTAALASLQDAEATPRALLKLAALMLAQAAPWMLILFVLFPRISGPLWGLPSDAYAGLTGLSGEMAPGMIQSLARSDAIAFRVAFDGAAPPKSALYWRGPVLTLLDGRVWRQADVRRSATPPYAPAPASPAYRYTVTLEAHDQPWLFALEWPAQAPAEAFFTEDFQLHAVKPVRERRRYALVSHDAVVFSDAAPERLAAALALPAGLNPRTVQLGAAWAAQGLSPAARVERALAFLREQRLVYSLQAPPTSEHVADEFLFETRRGFCEHFAASFVVLMRAAGVPARVVTGYQGGERNPVDDTWVIRQSDAHAWAEVWLADRGWVRIDPTAAAAPARIAENLAAALPAGEPLPLLARPAFDWLRALRYRWWAINHAWNQWVLGFDPERQRDLLTRFGMSSPDWRQMTVWLAGLSGLTLLALAAGLLGRRPHPDPVQRAWLRFTRRMARRGLPRRPWEGPLAYAERIAAEKPALADDVRAIARLYARLRYRDARSAAGLSELRRRIATCPPP
jgi:transglutaminase-like putative cysteine protease